MLRFSYFCLLTKLTAVRLHYTDPSPPQALARRAKWNLAAIQPILYAWSLFMAVSVAVIAHNHNHVPIWRSRFLNTLTDYWLTLFYGFPAFGWIPTHNKNHPFF